MTKGFRGCYSSFFLLFVVLFVILAASLPETFFRRVASVEIWTGDDINQYPDNVPEGELMCTSRGSPLLVSVSKKLIDRTCSALAPELGDLLESFIIPPQEFPQGSTGEILIHSFLVEHIQTQLAKPSPDEITVLLKGLSFVIADSSFTVSSGLTCSGVFWGNVENADLTISMQLVHGTERGELKANLTNMTLKWGSTKLHHKVLGKMCNIAEGVISTFLGDLDEYLMQKVEEELPRQLPGLIDTQIKNSLELSPLPFSNGPFLTNETVSFVFQMIGLTGVREYPPPPPLKLHLQHAERLTREVDVAILSTVESIQQRLHMLNCVGALGFHETLPEQYNSNLFSTVFPEAYELCRDCRVGVNLSTVKPWLVEFNPEAIDLKVIQMELELYLITNTKKQAEMMHDVILSDVGQLPLRRVWFTDDFTKFTPTRSTTRIPVGKIRAGATLSAFDMWSLNHGSSSKFYFKIHPVDEISLEIVEMNVRGLTEEEIRKGLVVLLNQGAIGLLHHQSPYELPSYLTDTEFTVNQDFLTFKFNLVVSHFLNKITSREEEVNDNDRNRDL